jgi:hypothetical protein
MAKKAAKSAKASAAQRCGTGIARNAKLAAAAKAAKLKAKRINVAKKRGGQRMSKTHSGRESNLVHHQYLRK